MEAGGAFADLHVESMHPEQCCRSPLACPSPLAHFKTNKHEGCAAERTGDSSQVQITLNKAYMPTQYAHVSCLLPACNPWDRTLKHIRDTCSIQDGTQSCMHHTPRTVPPHAQRQHHSIILSSPARPRNKARLTCAHHRATHSPHIMMHWRLTCRPDSHQTKCTCFTFHL